MRKIDWGCALFCFCCGAILGPVLIPEWNSLPMAAVTGLVSMSGSLAFDLTRPN